MCLSSPKPSLVESSSGFRLIPAGLYRHRIEYTVTKRALTFWMDYSHSIKGEQLVLIYLSQNPTWDNNDLIDFPALKELKIDLERSFRFKGYQVLFLSYTEKPVFDNHDSVAIWETPGGQWLDEISRSLDLTDQVRERLWREAEVEFIKASEGNLKIVDISARKKASKV